MSLRFLYCHGFASGPQSTKGVAFANHFASRGVTVDRLNLRVPSFEHLRLSAMIETARAAIGGPDDRAVMVGSSLGGLTTARTAERDPRVIAVMLLAPAFQLIPRWQQQLGPAWDEWQRTGWREVADYTTNAPARLDFAFTEDVAAVDVGFPELTIPTLICHGIHDDAVPVDHSRRFAAGRPNVRLIELDDDHELGASLPRLLAEADAFLGPFLR
ncbi:MAG: prolyl oligopeptidase family serine peptidase [Myxococcales bacterium]|nr:prolyl oligopeptidase family serine peptidase [Myxococcales bacterium]